MPEIQPGVQSSSLYKSNIPQLFWRCHPNPPDEIWNLAIKNATPILELPVQPANITKLLELTLGEGQFGQEHFQLSPVRRLYYQVKPILPRLVINRIKQLNASQFSNDGYLLSWPIEDRYARFLWEVASQLLSLTRKQELHFVRFWPKGKRFSLVLTHDVETERGLEFVEKVVDLEESLGFRSSFNFVPLGYTTPASLLQGLRKRGFEAGVHGLTHDGKLFTSRTGFNKKAIQINEYLNAMGAEGFRSPLMHREPNWMQALDIKFDCSFFDTDPYEPLPGGTMCIWPFFLGHFVELPYTLVQDCTLADILKQDHPDIWLEKVEFLARYHGMALLNSHPDYLIEKRTFSIYKELLQRLRDRNDYWQALPGEVAHWWRQRQEIKVDDRDSDQLLGRIFRLGNQTVIDSAY